MTAGMDADELALMRRIGGRIREARERAGLTQQQLASRVGLTRASVANVEAGRQRMNVTGLINMTAALGIGLNDLIHPPDFPPAPPPTHHVSVKRVHEAVCRICGCLGTWPTREAAQKVADNHIATALRKENRKQHE